MLSAMLCSTTALPHAACATRGGPSRRSAGTRRSATTGRTGGGGKQTRTTTFSAPGSSSTRPAARRKSASTTRHTIGRKGNRPLSLSSVAPIWRTSETSAFGLCCGTCAGPAPHCVSLLLGTSNGWIGLGFSQSTTMPTFVGLVAFLLPDQSATMGFYVRRRGSRRCRSSAVALASFLFRVSASSFLSLQAPFPVCLGAY